MNLAEIKKVLQDNLNKQPVNSQKRNIVFWYDAESEFVDDIKDLQLDNSKILHLTKHNSFYIKHLLEKEDSESNFLIYSPIAKPLPKENWLLDIEKYSEQFSTDKATVIMRNLGVKDESLRHIFKKYLKFFNNKERYKKFASYNIQDFTEQKIHVAVLSVLCKLQVFDFELVVKTILIEELNDKNRYIEQIIKFADINAFWNLVEKHYGYHLADKDIKQLLIMFMITNLSYNLESKIPSTWEKFISSKQADCIVFVDHFMSHSKDSISYDNLACKLESSLNINEYIKKWNIEDYLACDTFRIFDNEIIAWLINNLVNRVGEFSRYTNIINRRRTTHWFKQLNSEYEAIYYGMELLKLEAELQKTLRGLTAYELLYNYAKTYYQFDYYYRKFYLAFDRVENKDNFTQLQKVIENTYTHWFLEELSIKWSNIIADELKDDIRITGLGKQYEFYNKYIKSYVKNKERVFVIISDAFRYEAAKEFSDRLNIDRRGKVELSFMQGVVPSYTKLGMASLLPHQNIMITDNGDVLVDDINSAGTDNREKILKKNSSDAIAIQYNDMKDMNKSEYQKTLDGKKIVYIYHNVIDAIGDKASTERDVFEAVEKTFEDLSDLIKKLVDRVSATNIYITADHGFIYRRSALQEFNKVSRLSVQAIEQGRRFILAKERREDHGLLPLSMNYLLGNNTKMHVIVPRGTTRFKVQGAGANYVHGGASIQELLIPVIKYKNIRKNEFKATKVAVKLTNISRKITNRITYLEFFQTEILEDKKLPITLKLYFIDEDGKRISNENIIIADSKSPKPEDRTYREKFTLKDEPYDKTKQYYLVLEDENEIIEKINKKISFIIDLAIANDFGL